MGSVFDSILRSRGLIAQEAIDDFLNPDYEKFRHDPFLLPDMHAAVDRIIKAHRKKELVYIYGDYDIDGLTATTLLMDAFKSFDIACSAYIPNRFTEGYGLSEEGIRHIADSGADLIITVDCGSLSFDEIKLAKSLGLDVIVTDHHSVAETMPPEAVAVVNPKRQGHKYPFIDLAGVGVAFKLIQALQTKLPGLEKGQEKWLLDLVALGTVCDVVSLQDENRANVYWGIKVMQKTRRPGLKALIAASGLGQDNLSSRGFGFVLGPRLNASGRLEDARLSLDLLMSKEPMQALDLAYILEDKNKQRRDEQRNIFEEADKDAVQYADDHVLVLSNPGWSHGIIGIVAAKILEKHKKPTFVIQELGDIAKGSARSYGNFSAVDAINAAKEHLIKGGGHKLAAGITLSTHKIDDFRQAVNDYYKSMGLKRVSEIASLEAKWDTSVSDLGQLNIEIINELEKLQPFGHGNPQPLILLENILASSVRTMGDRSQHIKFLALDANDNALPVVGFNIDDGQKPRDGDQLSIVVELIVNEWRGARNLEARLIEFRR